MNLTKYVGLPWKTMGRDHSGVDCWGLVRLFYLQEKGVELPAYGGIGQGISQNKALAKEIHERMNHWQPVEQPRLGDCVLINIGGNPTHIGIVVDRQRMLHVALKANSVIEKFTSPKWASRIEGFYTYVAS